MSDFQAYYLILDDIDETQFQSITGSSFEIKRIHPKEDENEKVENNEYSDTFFLKNFNPSESLHLDTFYSQLKSYFETDNARTISFFHTHQGVPLSKQNVTVKVDESIKYNDSLQYVVKYTYNGEVIGCNKLIIANPYVDVTGSEYEMNGTYADICVIDKLNVMYNGNDYSPFVLYIITDHDIYYSNLITEDSTNMVQSISVNGVVFDGDTSYNHIYKVQYANRYTFSLILVQTESAEINSFLFPFHSNVKLLSRTANDHTYYIPYHGLIDVACVFTISEQIYKAIFRLFIPNPNAIQSFTVSEENRFLLGQKFIHNNFVNIKEAIHPTTHTEHLPANFIDGNSIIINEGEFDISYSYATAGSSDIQFKTRKVQVMKPSIQIQDSSSTTIYKSDYIGGNAFTESTISTEPADLLTKYNNQYDIQHHSLNAFINDKLKIRGVQKTYRKNYELVYRNKPEFNEIFSRDITVKGNSGVDISYVLIGGYALSGLTSVTTCASFAQTIDVPIGRLGRVFDPKFDLFFKIVPVLLGDSTSSEFLTSEMSVSSMNAAIFSNIEQNESNLHCFRFWGKNRRILYGETTDFSIVVKNENGDQQTSYTIQVMISNSFSGAQTVELPQIPQFAVDLQNSRPSINITEPKITQPNIVIS